LEEETKSAETNNDLTKYNEVATPLPLMSNQMSPISQGSPISGNGYAPSPYTALNVISNDKNLLSLEKLEQIVKQKIHSRKFRE
jgi:hypothetical protein